MKSNLSPIERFRRNRERKRLYSLERLAGIRVPKKQKERLTLEESEEIKKAEATKAISVMEMIDAGERNAALISEKVGCTRSYVYLIFSSLGLSDEFREKMKEEQEAKRVEKISRLRSVGDRFWMKVKRTESCWVWQGAKNTKTGYGGFWNGSKHSYAHRFSYEFFNQRQIPKGLEIDHVCRNRSCVNPDHLQAVTHRENVLRGNVPHVSKENIKKAHEAMRIKNANRKFCKRGHEWKVENWVISEYEKKGHRACRICRNILSKKTSTKAEKSDRMIG